MAGGDEDKPAGTALDTIPPATSTNTTQQPRSAVSTGDGVLGGDKGSSSVTDRDPPVSSMNDRESNNAGALSTKTSEAKPQHPSSGTEVSKTTAMDVDSRSETVQATETGTSTTAQQTAESKSNPVQQPSVMQSSSTTDVPSRPVTSSSGLSAASAPSVPQTGAPAAAPSVQPQQTPASRKRPRPSDPYPTAAAASSLSSSSAASLLWTPEAWPFQVSAVEQTVGNILHLLQTYGPLTAGQVEYNLPPPPSASSMGATTIPSSVAAATHAPMVAPTTSHLQRTGQENNGRPLYTVQDILQILVAVGVVQQLKDENEGVASGNHVGNNNKATTIDTTTAPPVPRYACQAGLPRADPVVIRRPKEVMKRIEQAVTETQKSQQRQKVLLEALLQWQPDQRQHGGAADSNRSHHRNHATRPTASTTTPRAVLTRLLADAPELVQDPVYATALRICHVDMSAAGGALLGTTSAITKTTSTSSGTASARTTTGTPSSARQQKDETTEGTSTATARPTDPAAAAASSTNAAAIQTGRAVLPPSTVSSSTNAVPEATTATVTTTSSASASASAAAATTTPFNVSAAETTTVSAASQHAEATGTTVDASQAETTSDSSQQGDKTEDMVTTTTTRVKEDMGRAEPTTSAARVESIGTAAATNASSSSTMAVSKPAADDKN